MMKKHSFFAFSILIALQCLLLSGCTSGSVRRVAYVSTTPAGAHCRVNDVYYGVTPVEVPYLWNWYYEIKLEKDGYATVEDTKKFRAGILNTMPLDLLMEALPFRTYEKQKLNYTLTPQK